MPVGAVLCHSEPGDMQASSPECGPPQQHQQQQKQKQALQAWFSPSLGHRTFGSAGARPVPFPSPYFPAHKQPVEVGESKAHGTIFTQHGGAARLLTGGQVDGWPWHWDQAGFTVMHTHTFRNSWLGPLSSQWRIITFLVSQGETIAVLFS